MKMKKVSNQFWAKLESRTISENVKHEPIVRAEGVRKIS